jgi:hypothetical protein
MMLNYTSMTAATGITKPIPGKCMIEIFIPVLFICLNNNCEFMQSTGYFRVEDQCRTDLEKQKQHMRNLVKEAGQGEASVLEGTCIDVKIKSKTEKDI